MHCNDTECVYLQTPNLSLSAGGTLSFRKITERSVYTVHVAIILSEREKAVL